MEAMDIVAILVKVATGFLGFVTLLKMLGIIDTPAKDESPLETPQKAYSMSDLLTFDDSPQAKPK